MENISRGNKTFKEQSWLSMNLNVTDEFCGIKRYFRALKSEFLTQFALRNKSFSLSHSKASESSSLPKYLFHVLTSQFGSMFIALFALNQGFARLIPQLKVHRFDTTHSFSLAFAQKSSLKFIIKRNLTSWFLLKSFRHHFMFTNLHSSMRIWHLWTHSSKGVRGFNDAELMQSHHRGENVSGQFSRQHNSSSAAAAAKQSTHCSRVLSALWNSHHWDFHVELVMMVFRVVSKFNCRSSFDSRRHSLGAADCRLFNDEA